MQPSLMGWVSFVVLAALIGLTSCQAWQATGGGDPAVQTGETNE
ncbi:MAG: hypothetical protein AAF666_11865 [Pseudomonadota bacterium]